MLLPSPSSSLGSQSRGQITVGSPRLIHGFDKSPSCREKKISVSLWSCFRGPSSGSGCSCRQLSEYASSPGIMRAGEFEFECGVTRRGRRLKLRSLCPHSAISRPGSKLIFSRLYRSEQSSDLRATRLEQGRDLKPEITQITTLINFLTRIENFHISLRSPADQLLI